MKLWTKLKKEARRFKKDPSGKRFQNLHERLHSKGGKLPMMLLGLVLGVVLIACGVLLGLVPGVPGVVLVVLGIALIASQFRPLAKWCDIADLAIREFIIKIRGSRHF